MGEGEGEGAVRAPLVAAAVVVEVGDADDVDVTLRLGLAGALTDGVGADIVRYGLRIQEVNKTLRDTCHQNQTVLDEH